MKNEIKEIADKQVEEALYKCAIGFRQTEERVLVDRKGKIKVVKTVKHYPPNILATIFWLKNRRN